MNAVDKKAVTIDRLDMGCAANQGNRRTGTRQHSAEITSHSPGADCGNPGPFFFRHVASKKKCFWLLAFVFRPNAEAVNEKRIGGSNRSGPKAKSQKPEATS
jgi:hypothetical protein